VGTETTASFCTTEAITNPDGSWSVISNKPKKKKRQQMLGGEVEPEKDYRIKEEETLPFACLMCRNPFVDPVVTRCEHYFCESCALGRYAKDTKCFVCNQQTLGVFNTAHKVLARQTKQKKKDATVASGQAEAEEPVAEKTMPHTGQEGWVMR